MARRAAPSERPDTGRTAFLPMRSLREKAFLWLGMAALLSWVDLLFCFEGVLRDSVAEGGGLVHDPVFFGATLAAGVALVTAALAQHAAQRDGAPAATRQLASFLPGARRRIGAIALTCVAGGACALTAIGLTVFAPTGPSLLARTLGLAIGLVVAWSILAWGECLSRIDLREALLAVSAASCLQWVPLLVACSAPVPVHAAFAAALPAVWGICLAQAERDGMSESDARRPRASRQVGPASDTAHDLPRMAATMFAFSAVIQFTWCFFIKMLPGRLEVGLFPLVFAVVVAASGLVALMCARLMDNQRSYRLELYYRCTMLFCLCGVAATAVAAGSAQDAAWELLASYALVYVGYSFVCPTMWLLSLGYASMRLERPSRVVGLVFGGQFLGFFAGSSCVDAMRGSGLADLGPQMAPAAVLVLVALLAVAYLAVFPERNLLSLSPLLFGMSHESLDERCAQVAREHGLTPREAEILTLLARGRDAEYVSDALDIARNTVNAHRKSIYAKLGVHSQQELLSVVEQAQG